MRALVTLVIGIDYENNFERYCRNNWTAYARRHGYDLVILKSRLDTSPRANARPIYWQKNLILEQPELADYEQVAWIDSDIIINAERAPPIFDSVPKERIGAVDEYRIPDAATYRKALAGTYLRARRLGQPFFHNLTPEEFYRIRGFPAFSGVVQGGMIVSSPSLHRDVFRAVYAYEDIGVTASNYEMGALSYEILSRDLVTWLDYRFNQLVLLGIGEHLPTVRRQPAGKHSTRTDSDLVGATVAKLYENCFFLHFAGCRALMKYLP